MTIWIAMAKLGQQNSLGVARSRVNLPLTTRAATTLRVHMRNCRYPYRALELPFLVRRSELLLQMRITPSQTTYLPLPSA